MAESIEHYARTVEQIITEQRVLKFLKTEVPKRAVPLFRKAVKERALDTLPKRGGLNEWVAASTVKAKTTVTGERINIHLTGGRNSQGGESDLKRIDAGRARHPTWGRRTRGSWFVTTVQSGFFTEPAADPTPWTEAADAALDQALEVIR